MTMIAICDGCGTQVAAQSILVDHVATGPAAIAPSGWIEFVTGEGPPVAVCSLRCARHVSDRRVKDEKRPELGQGWTR